MIKKRYWAFVLYPESAPENWNEILQQTGLSIAISPYHDSDKDPNGLPKKPHYHIILCYGGPTTYNNVKTLTDSLNCPHPISLEQVRGYYRYLTHKDNPDKFQYNDRDIKILNGFNILDYTDKTRYEIINILYDLQKIIRDNNITEYCDLLDFLLDSDMLEFLDVAYNHTILLNTYICSLRNKQKNC